MNPHDEMQRFLSIIFPEPLASGLTIEIRGVRKDSAWREFYPSVEAVVADYDKLREWNEDGRSIYVAAAVRNGRDGTKDGCERVYALWADLDETAYSTAGTTRESIALHQDFLRHELKTALPDRLAPTMIVNSGRGLQAWWLFSNPWAFEKKSRKADVLAIESVLKGLQPVLHSDIQRTDISSVMRLPGFLNPKYDHTPLAQIESIDEARRFTLDDFAEYAPAAAPMGQETDHELVSKFEQALLYIRDGGDGRKHYVICPWKSEHSEDSGPTETAIFTPDAGDTPGFKCLHAHCADKRINDVYEFFKEQGKPRELKGTRLTRAAKVETTPEPEDNVGNVADGLCIVRLSDVPARRVAWLWKGYIPKGMLTIFAGDPDQGKSMITTDLTGRITTGSAWPDGTPGSDPADVVLLSSEDALHETVAPRMLAAKTDMSRVQVIKSVNIEGKKGCTFSIARDLQTLDAAYACEPFSTLIIDPLDSYLPDVDAYRNNEVRGVLGPLAEWAEQRGVAVIAIMHMGKTTERNALQRVLGSTAFTAAARACYVACRNFDVEGQQLFLPSKLNIGRKQPGLAYRIETRLVMGEDGEQIEIGGIEWVGAVTVTAEEALKHLSKTGPQARSEAMALLKAILKDGPVEADVIEARARVAGVSHSTLKRAKLDSGVQSLKVGFEGRWYWVPGLWTEKQINAWRDGILIAELERQAAGSGSGPVHDPAQ